VTTKQFPTCYGTTVHTFESFYYRSTVISFGLLLLLLSASSFQLFPPEPSTDFSSLPFLSYALTTYHFSLDEFENILEENFITP
jgi:hypothetical protein